MVTLEADAGSFRDPSGRVYSYGDRVFRTVSRKAAPSYEAARDSGILQKHAERKTLIASQEVDPSAFDFGNQSVAYLVEHPKIPFISYPYEWSFALLKEAALFHLDFHRDLFNDGFTTSDASAYNVQFLGPAPLFIDTLSIRKYKDGEYWLAHNQFCEQFLNPLLLRSYIGISYNDWFRGRLEGIPTDAVSRLLPAYRKLSLRVLGHIVGPARLQAQTKHNSSTAIGRRPLPRNAYLALLGQLRRWISTLEPSRGATQWQDYQNFHSYSPGEENAKLEFVSRFITKAAPSIVWDIGCNTGEYSALALQSGARKVIGFDYDHGALDLAFARAKDQNLDLLPIYLDGANPSPRQGWAQVERQGLADRRNADAIIALAFIHHLAIGRNIPLREAVNWLTGLANCGLIEFVQKDDPMIREMLALREDVFEEYSEENFVKAISDRANIVATRRNPENGRLLVAYEGDH
jgi:ribosomal protein L11 methylase PrmA